MISRSWTTILLQVVERNRSRLDDIKIVFVHTEAKRNVFQTHEYATDWEAGTATYIGKVIKRKKTIPKKRRTKR